jgi:hypothetical protein
MSSRMASLRKIPQSSSFIVCLSVLSSSPLTHLSCFHSFLRGWDLRCLRYYQEVKNPMDLATLDSRVEKGKYRTWGEFGRDMLLIYEK